jgi:hypothetical protein
VSPSTSSESYSEKARRHILNGETAEGLSLFREDEGRHRAMTLQPDRSSRYLGIIDVLRARQK